MLLSGIRARWFVIAFLLMVTILSVILLLYFFFSDIFITIFGNDLFYRLERIFDWTTGTGIQLENAISSIGSAGLFGHGFRNTPIYFPESGTDFIFAVFASNFGLFGVIILISIFLFLNIHLLYLIKRKIHHKDKYLIIGILGMFVFQQIQNIGMTVGLFPITGITLPFISYGGSSLLSYLFIVGILLNISMEKDQQYE